MRLYNSLSKQSEEFVPLKKGQAGMYTCGMTVYDYAHIGHGRKYVMDDVLRRLLAYNGYTVTHVQNVTDVGHLVSDEDEGEDKMEKGARKAGKDVWEVAEYFTRDFYASLDLLNILRPSVVCKATEHIKEQIEMVALLLKKGFAYETPEAIYFEVSKFPRYGQLFNNESKQRQTARREDVVTGEHKRSPEDFALWFKRVGRFANHQMHWDSPWGEGFPGWHIECSAMGMKYLGETFDIHTGGIEHQDVHHPNEIAQSEAMTGKPLARYWVHCGFLTVDGQKMSKSIGNVYRVQDVIDKGFDAMALRYLYLTSYYRSPLNFTWSSLTAAQSALDKLHQFVANQKVGSLPAGRQAGKQRVELSREKLKKLDGFRARFWEGLNNDMGTPQAMAVLWEMMKSNIPDYDKTDLLFDWDRVLGLKLAVIREDENVPSEIKSLVGKREQLRKSGKFVDADEVRLKIEKAGYTVEDSAIGPKVRSKRP